MSRRSVRSSRQSGNMRSSLHAGSPRPLAAASRTAARGRARVPSECDADIRYKEAYLHADEADIAIVKSPVGMPGRAIMNPFMKKVMAGEKIPHSPCHRCLHQCDPAEIPYCITDALIHAAKGETDEALLFCGAYAYKAERLETVKEVIDSLIGESIIEVGKER